MRQLATPLMTTLIVALLSCSAMAQAQDSNDEPGARRPRFDRRAQRAERRQREAPAPGFERMVHPLMVALDADKDGTLSKEEIANAATALATLDKDGDGILSREELRPPRPFGGPGPWRGGDRTGPADPDQIVQRWMQLDQDGDGRITKDELPERMTRILERADTNQDGALDRQELDELAKQMTDRTRSRGSQRGTDRPRSGRRRAPADRQDEQ